MKEITRNLQTYPAGRGEEGRPGSSEGEDELLGGGARSEGEGEKC